MELMQWLNSTLSGEFIFTALVSMLPVVELRGGVPFGVAGLGLSYNLAFVAAVIGNILPAPFVIIYARRFLQFLRRHFHRFDGVVDTLETKAHLKGERVSRYKGLGLYLLVAVPLPGTGVWTGSLVAAFLDMPLRKAMPSIILGVIAAGFIMTGLTAMGINVFA